MEGYLIRRLVFATGVVFSALASPVRAQLVSAGIGPAFPSGDFNSQLNPGDGFYFSGRANLSLIFLTLQFELSHADWSWNEPSGEATAKLWQPAINLGFRFVRVGPVRPYILAGVVGSSQDFQTEQYNDSSVRVGWQAGAGVDFSLGPLKPFVEFRWVDLDGPGDIHVKYSPLIFGIGIF